MQNMDAPESLAKPFADRPSTHENNARWLEEMQNPEIQPQHHVAMTGTLSSYSIEAGAGALGGLVPRVLEATAPETGSILPMLADGAVSGARAMATGMLAGGAVAGLDMLGQRLTDHNIGGHDLLRPTGLEELGIGLAVASPLGWRAKLAIAGFSWLAGRVENYFET
jgi:hypothetical protein